MAAASLVGRVDQLETRLAERDRCIARLEAENSALSEELAKAQETARSYQAQIDGSENEPNESPA